MYMFGKTKRTKIGKNEAFKKKKNAHNTKKCNLKRLHF